MDLNNLSKKELKKLIQIYNKYIDEFDYSEQEKRPLNVNDFYESEYQYYLDKPITIKDIESQKDDLFVVYSTDAYQSKESRENISYCSNIDFAHQVVADLNRDSDYKYVIAKTELDSEVVNESLLEVYDGLDGLEWKSPLSNIDYNEFPKKKEFKQNTVSKSKLKLDERFGAGHLGGVDTVMWDRTLSENGDFKRVGVIDNRVAKLEPDYENDVEAIEFARKMGAEKFDTKEKEIEIFTYEKIPTWALPALINGDYENLTDEESKALSALEKSLPNLGMDGHWGNYSEEYYSSTTNLDNYGGNVVDLDYIVTKNKESETFNQSDYNKMIEEARLKLKNLKEELK